MIMLDLPALASAVNICRITGLELMPLFRAGLDGTLALGHVKREFGALAGVTLPPAGRPAVIMLTALGSSPSEWPCLSALRAWGDVAMVHAMKPDPADYEFGIELCLQRNRLVLVHAWPSNAADWAEALAPVHVEMLAL